MKKIYYEPDEIWTFIQQNPDYGWEVMAENDDYSIVLLIDPGYSSLIVVSKDSAPVEEEITDEEQCESIAEELYEEYLNDGEIDVIEERESELTSYTEEFLIGATSKVHFAQDYQNQDKLVEKIKERLLEVIYKEFKLEPYRPMVLIDEDGGEVFSEYPYKLLY